MGVRGDEVKGRKGLKGHKGWEMTMSDIKVIDASVTTIAEELEWFIPVYDFNGDGAYWSVFFAYRTKEGAEEYIKNNDAIKLARIIRVMLPCKVVP